MASIRKKFDTPELIAICMMLWALMPFNPYGYYVFLKLVICGITAYLAKQAHDANRGRWVYVFIGLAILYNPFVHIPLDRLIWMPINIITVIIIIKYAALKRKSA